ncbi:MAG: 6-hydroxymethylpterin diphosphokinase MptE-like protein [Oleiphilaceae bacterium]|nr:6-hydroxymethylpterin diphosphokinase MptE-like protein [Oleiphilaceae bacterium]
MAPTKQEVAQQFLRRRDNNLRFFQKTQPALYRHFQSFRMSRVEVQVGTEGSDVDLVVDGQSWYQGRAKAHGTEEAKQFLAEYQPGKTVQSIVPPFAESINRSLFTSEYQRQCLEKSAVTQDNFAGFRMSNFLPSVIFMGVGLGYHIEAVSRQVDIVDAIIFEPDDEVFAASLFTVDWAAVCQRFQGRKGYSLRFLITPSGRTDQQLQELLEREVHKSAPLFPVISSYFNHRGQTRMNELALSIGRDTSAHLTTWGNYDDELRRMNNMLHNTRQTIPLLKPESVNRSSLPVLIVGSGPSIDGRMEQIRQLRSQVILVSAGTGIRALTANGLSPDFHVELDPQYSVYQHLVDVDQEMTRETTLLAVAEVNPLVTELFRHCHFYVKDRSPYPALFDAQDYAFRLCNPTCTNAALSLFVQLGFRNLFLLGCDYGFQSAEKHHSGASVYREEGASEISRAFKERTRSRYHKKNLFLVDGVSGEPVYTKADYHGAKKEIETQIRYWKKEHDEVQVRNCSDGAVIEGAPWMSGDDFMASVRLQQEEVPQSSVLRGLLPTTELSTAPDQQKAIVDGVNRGLRERATQLKEALSGFQLRGKKDISRASRFVSAVNERRDPSAAQRTAAHLLSGTTKWFLVAGFSHAMAHEDGPAVNSFLKGWQNTFNALLHEIPEHFSKRLSRRLPVSEDPLVTRGKWEAEVDAAETPSPEGGQG